MADREIGNSRGITVVGGDNTGNNDNDNLDSIASMKARLQVIDATKYSDSVLSLMTYNDLMYAIRVEDAPATVN